MALLRGLLTRRQPFRSIAVCGGTRRAGGGAVLLVLEHSSHDTSNDVVQLFAPRLRWLLAKVRSRVGLLAKVRCRVGLLAKARCRAGLLAKTRRARLAAGPAQGGAASWRPAAAGPHVHAPCQTRGCSGGQRCASE
jgi:hypothetical protein